MKWLTELRAGILVAQDRTTEAAALYRELLESDPTHVSALISVLMDCAERNAVDETIRVATRALAIDTRNFMALQALGWAHASSGNHAAARPIVTMAVEQYDAQGLGEVSRKIAGAVRRFSRRPESAGESNELSEWRRWADSYLASSRTSTEGDSAG